MKSCNSCKYQPGCAGWHCSCEKKSKEDYCCDNYTPEGWISVEDRLPEELKMVLVYSKSNGVWIGRYSGTAFILIDDLGIDEGVTHWMPLPNNPSKSLTSYNRKVGFEIKLKNEPRRKSLFEERSRKLIDEILNQIEQENRK